MTISLSKGFDSVSPENWTTPFELSTIHYAYITVKPEASLFFRFVFNLEVVTTISKIKYFDAKFKFHL